MAQTLKLNTSTVVNILSRVVTYAGAEVVYLGTPVSYL